MIFGILFSLTNSMIKRVRFLLKTRPILLTTVSVNNTTTVMNRPRNSPTPNPTPIEAETHSVAAVVKPVRKTSFHDGARSQNRYRR